MNVEENRLQTFSDWPRNAEVNPQRIAKAGFFYTKRGSEVECFACHVKLTDFNYGDQVMARHKFLSPKCPFVLNPADSGNVAIISIPFGTIQGTTTRPAVVNYRDSEQDRLGTFEGWPAGHIVTPEALARAGFYYLKDGDSTKCAFCQGVVRAWEEDDDPDVEHKRHFPQCQFVIDTINPRLRMKNAQSEADNLTHPSSNNNLLLSERNLDELGVQAHRGPKRSNFATVSARLRSFTSWSSDLIQTPELLSEAGFYYEGLGDQVRCFHCDGGLRHWDPHDDPWTEHARWFPTCAFVKLVKGQEFVNACSLEQDTTVQSPTKVQASRRRRVTEQEVQEQLRNGPAVMALSIGLNIERVKRAIRERLENYGVPYSQPDALVEAALNLQFDEDSECAAEDVVNDGRSREASWKKDDTNEGQHEEIEITSTTSASAMTPPKLKNSTSLEEENRLLKEARLCKICMDGEMGIVFLPCGHLATCVNCAPNLEDCPVCRSAIKATVRTFLS